MPEPEKRKRLPVLQSPPEGEEMPPEERPPTHWVIATAIITVIGWLLLAGTTSFVLQRLGVRSAAAVVVAFLTTLFLAAGIAGLIAARLGKKADRKHALYGTLCGAGVGWMLSLSQGLSAVSLPFWLVVLALLCGCAAAGGATGYRLGQRR